MKHSHSHHHQAQGNGPHLVPVRFEFVHPTAVEVSVAGTFNNWDPTAKPLHSAGNGRWVKETVLAPGSYEYRMVVDGEWVADPGAQRQVPNPFGGNNSILTVTDGTAPESVAVLADSAPENTKKIKTVKV